MGGSYACKQSWGLASIIAAYDSGPGIGNRISIFSFLCIVLCECPPVPCDLEHEIAGLVLKGPDSGVTSIAELRAVVREGGDGGAVHHHRVPNLSA